MASSNVQVICTDVLDNFGVAIKLEWLEQLLQQLQTAHAGGFMLLPRDHQRQSILEQLLVADFRAAGAGGHLPPAVKDLHKLTIHGKFMMQLDEVVNISAGFKDRYKEYGPQHRTLKLHLTDGVQQLVAIEYRPCPALAVLMTAGQKLLIINPLVRRGILLLQPENVVVLGGVVDYLEAARQRLLKHVDKPADHCAARRTCQQAYEEAAAAAWDNAGSNHQQQVPVGAAAPGQGNGEPVPAAAAAATAAVAVTGPQQGVPAAATGADPAVQGQQQWQQPPQQQQQQQQQHAAQPEQQQRVASSGSNQQQGQVQQWWGQQQWQPHQQQPVQQQGQQWQANQQHPPQLWQSNQQPSRQQQQQQQQPSSSRPGGIQLPPLHPVRRERQATTASASDGNAAAAAMDAQPCGPMDDDTADDFAGFEGMLGAGNEQQQQQEQQHLQSSGADAPEQQRQHAQQQAYRVTAAVAPCTDDNNDNDDNEAELLSEDSLQGQRQQQQQEVAQQPCRRQQQQAGYSAGTSAVLAQAAALDDMGDLLSMAVTPAAARAHEDDSLDWDDLNAPLEETRARLGTKTTPSYPDSRLPPAAAAQNMLSPLEVQQQQQQQQQGASPSIQGDTEQEIGSMLRQQQQQQRHRTRKRVIDSDDFDTDEGDDELEGLQTRVKQPQATRAAAAAVTCPAGMCAAARGAADVHSDHRALETSEKHPAAAAAAAADEVPSAAVGAPTAAAAAASISATWSIAGLQVGGSTAAAAATTPAAAAASGHSAGSGGGGRRVLSVSRIKAQHMSQSQQPLSQQLVQQQQQQQQHANLAEAVGRQQQQQKARVPVWNASEHLTPESIHDIDDSQAVEAAAHGPQVPTATVTPVTGGHGLSHAAVAAGSGGRTPSRADVGSAAAAVAAGSSGPRSSSSSGGPCRASAGTLNPLNLEPSNPHSRFRGCRSSAAASAAPVVAGWAAAAAPSGVEAAAASVATHTSFTRGTGLSADGTATLHGASVAAPGAAGTTGFHNKLFGNLLAECSDDWESEDGDADAADVPCTSAASLAAAAAAVPTTAAGMKAGAYGDCVPIHSERSDPPTTTAAKHNSMGVAAGATADRPAPAAAAGPPRSAQTAAAGGSGSCKGRKAGSGGTKGAGSGSGSGGHTADLRSMFQRQQEFIAAGALKSSDSRDGSVANGSVPAAMGGSRAAAAAAGLPRQKLDWVKKPVERQAAAAVVIDDDADHLDMAMQHLDD